MLKSLPKIITTFFLAIFVLQLVCLIFIFLLPQAGQAATATATFTPQVGISTDFQAGVAKTPDGSTAMIAQYIRAIYKYAIGIVGILAAVVLMIGGVMWIVAGGSATAIGEAKSWIGASLTGLVIALCSYLILATVNPALVDLKTTTITAVQTTTTTGSCLIPSLVNGQESTCEDNVTQDQCTKDTGVTWASGSVCPTACCAWDTNIIASALTQVQCRIQYPLSNCLFASNSYNSCDDTNKNLTEAQCSAKSSGPTLYVSNGKCNKQTLIGTTDTLTSYQCIAK